VAKAGAKILPPKSAPLLVPLGRALNCLHDNHAGALTRAASHRRCDRKTLDGLLERLVRLGARARGNIDRAPPSWIESSELLDYQIGYIKAFARGMSGSQSLASKADMHILRQRLGTMARPCVARMRQSPTIAASLTT
jgi:hypothetical protein